MRLISYICLLLLLASTFNALAQMENIGSPNVASFSRTTYQAGTQNWAILQDDRGLVYFANNKGLLEFDGTNWQVFPLPNETIVRSVAIDAKGRLYIGGQDEFGYLEFDNKGKGVYRSLTDLVPTELRSFEDIWKIYISEEVSLFCSKKAIFRLEDGKMKAILPKGQRFENFFKLNDKILVQDFEKGLFELEGEQLVAVAGGDRFPGERITAILPYEQGRSLLITFSKGIFCMDQQGVQPWKVDADVFLKEHQAYCAIQLKNGKYAIGTPQNGLIIMGHEGDVELHLSKKNGLQNNTVLSVAQDIQQNLWLGLDNGIDYAEINSPFERICAEEDLLGTGYASVVQDGKLYLGTNQGLFYKELSKGGSSLNSQKFKLVENALGQVWNINEIDGHVVICQHKGASFLKDGRAEPFSNIQGAWKFLKLESQPGYILKGAYSGLYLYQAGDKGTVGGQTPDWRLLRRLEGFDESARIFEEDQDGNIWIAHAYKGLFKVKLSDDLQSVEQVKLYDPSSGLPEKLPINVSKIRNELVFTSPEGVFKYDKVSDRFIPHEGFVEIFGSGRNFHRVLEDKFGNVWFSVDHEFGMLKVQEQGIFNKFDVFYFNQIQEELVDGFEYVYAYDEQNVLIGTEKGFVHYSPLQNKNIDFPFNLLIRKVTSITERDSIVYWGNTIEKVPQAFAFPNAMNDFRFAFSAPYFEKISYLTYRYKLEGFENEWAPWSPKTEKEYTNLPAGNYAFKVQARNAYGQMSDEVVFAFKIFPPWYWSWYARVSYFSIVMLTLFGLVKYISKREELKTEAFKKEQTQKLERKEAEFKKEVEKSEGEIIKLRNEKLNADIKHKNSRLASVTMHLVQKSEILMKIKNDLKKIESEAPHAVKKKLHQITRTIESDIQLDDNWEQFETYFDQVHENFFKRLRLNFPELTPKDQKLCAYLRMNLTSKEIAPLLKISVRGVEISRYRLRKKLGLNPDVNLVSFIMEV
ncbi:MAG: triple tyrosine motif-containing protein [Bacteroidota bacterium]